MIPGPKQQLIDDAPQAITAEITAVLQRMRGLSTDGIIQALADMGRDSLWFAAEMARLYAGTDEVHFKTKLLGMMVDILKQKEGQKLHVDDMRQASERDIKTIEAEAIEEVRKAVKEGLIGQEELAQIGIEYEPAPSRSLPSPARLGDAEESKGGAGQAIERDTVPLRRHARGRKVPSKRR
jgi:hypothetical protein